MITEDCDDTDNAAAEFTFTKQNFVTNSKLIQRCFVQTQKNLTMIFWVLLKCFTNSLCFSQKKSILQICQTRVGGWLHERLICCIEDLLLPLGWEALSEEHWVTRPKNFIETDTETFFWDQNFRDRDRDFFSRPNIFETDTETFFETNFFKTETETFFETKFFGSKTETFFKTRFFSPILRLLF